MARIYVGLSGGVDSAVSAALLKEAGHEVYGCFIRIWRPQFLECTWKEDRLDALRVAAHLGIPFRETDLSLAYEDAVITPMIAAYQRGETPNPDMTCNQRIKFDAFLSWALAEGADMVATGHYARLDHDPLRLLRGSDPSKDQSYFLAQVGRAALARALFPVGGLMKTEVRRIAQSHSLPVARKRDSQGLCFVGDITLPEFISRYVPPRTGHILNQSGEVVGEHPGAMFFTIGQRHGLALASQRPYYVVATDVSANTVTVSHDPSDARSASFVIRDTNWIGEPALGATYTCVPRYRHVGIPCTIDTSDGQTRVRLDRPETVVRGQTCALYDADMLVGSGIIC